MAITYVGAASAASDSVSLPSFQDRDIAIVIAMRSSSTIVPALPAGWTSITTDSTAIGVRLGYRILLPGDTTTGTWLDADYVGVAVYRGTITSTPWRAITTANLVVGSSSTSSTGSASTLGQLGIALAISSAATVSSVSNGTLRNGTGTRLAVIDAAGTGQVGGVTFSTAGPVAYTSGLSLIEDNGFPQVIDQDTKQGTQTSNSGSWTGTYPTNLAAGDLILVVIAADGSPSISIAGGLFTGSTTGGGLANASAVYAKISDGSETGNFTINCSGSNEQGSWIAYRVVNWYGNLASGLNAHDTLDWPTVTFSNGTDSNPNPPSRNPNPWGTENTLWFAFSSSDTSRTYSAYPSSPDTFTNTGYLASGGSTGATLAWARLEKNASSVDPGTFTHSASDDWVTATVAVRPRQFFNVVAQAQAQITGGGPVTYRSYGQSNADIKRTYTVPSQAQADVKQIYQSYAQAQASISRVTFASAQAIAWIIDSYVQVYADDNFSRSVTDGWGSADIAGGSYTLSGTAADFDVNGNQGTINLPTAGSARSAYLSVSAWDGDLLVRVKTDKLAAGAQHAIGVGMHVIDASNYYKVEVRLQTDNSAIMQIQRIIGGASTGVGAGSTISGLTMEANTFYWFRAQIITGGTSTGIKGKFWKDGTAEPASWQEDQTDSNATLRVPGGVILHSNLGGAYSNAPTLLTWDDLHFKSGPGARVFSQAQAQIKQTYQSYAQSQSNIKQTYYVCAQAQASIVKTTQAYAQAQTDIKATYYANAQAQADIKQVYFVPAQAQASIKQIYQGYAQAQAAVKGNAFAQAQAQIKQTYQGYAQAQTSIKGNAFAQAQAQIKQVYYVWAQSQATLVSTYWGLAQAASSIKQTYYAVAQAQANIKKASTYSAQALADIKQTYPISSPGATIASDTFTGSDVALTSHTADIGGTWSFLKGDNVVRSGSGIAYCTAAVDPRDGYYQLSSTSFTDGQLSWQGVGWHSGVLFRLVDSNNFYMVVTDGVTNATVTVSKWVSGIKTDIGSASVPTGSFPWFRVDVSGTSPTRIRVRSWITTEPGTWDIDINDSSAALQVQNKPIGIVVGADTTFDSGSEGHLDNLTVVTASILEGPTFAQAQGYIKQTYSAVAQAKTSIKQTYQGYAQSDASIKQTYQSYAQAEAQISAGVTTYNVVAQAQASIIQIYVVSAQAQVQIKQIYYEFAQSQAVIVTTYFVNAQAQASIKATYYSVAQSQASVKQTYNSFAQAQATVQGNAFAQAQADIKQIYWGFAQAQAAVKGNAFAQAQGSIKQIYSEVAQAQSDIKQTYYVVAQAQAGIVQTSQVYAQAQSSIKSTYFNVAQAEGSIKQTYFAVAQAQATVKGNAFAQAQADIKQTYQDYAQAQSQIKQTYYVSAQAQASIKQTYYAVAQAQANIKTTYYVHAQAQSSITNTYFGLAQAQATVQGNAFAQAQADIKATYFSVAQAQGSIKATYFSPAQSQATIVQSYQAFANSQTNIKSTYTVYAQAQAEIKQTYYSNAQAQSQIKQTYFAVAQAQAAVQGNAFAQAQASISQTYYVHAQSQAKLNAFDVQAYGQAQAQLGAASQQVAQAQAKINAFDVSEYGQAQAQILATYAGYAQAEGSIKQTYNVYAQAQSNIKTTYNSFAQSQADINQIYSNTANAQAQIKSTYNGFAQAQSSIRAVVSAFAQAQGSILATSQVYAQAQAQIKATYHVFAQAQSNIRTIYSEVAQSQASILTTNQSYAQAQAQISTSYQVYAQANSQIKTIYYVHAQAESYIIAITQQYGQSQASIYLAQYARPIADLVNDSWIRTVRD